VIKNSVTDVQKRKGAPKSKSTVTASATTQVHAHTDIITKKAYRVLGLISKSFECKDSDVIIKLYTIATLVQPIVEYNNILWGPTYILDNQKLEKSNVEQPE